MIRSRRHLRRIDRASLEGHGVSAAPVSSSKRKDMRRSLVKAAKPQAKARRKTARKDPAACVSLLSSSLVKEHGSQSRPRSPKTKPTPNPPAHARDPKARQSQRKPKTPSTPKNGGAPDEPHIRGCRRGVNRSSRTLRTGWATPRKAPPANRSACGTAHMRLGKRDVKRLERGD